VQFIPDIVGPILEMTLIPENGNVVVVKVYVVSDVYYFNHF